MSVATQIPIQEIHLNRLQSFGVELKIARADQIHSLASGNKIYKLKPIIEYAKINNIKQILSFGGAYSNHIHAFALLAQKYNIESVAIIRGEAKYAENPTLSDAQKVGMSLEFVSRAEYKLRNDEHYLAQLQLRYPDALIVPEGGSSQLAIGGCAQMARDINGYHNFESNDFESGLCESDIPESDILTVASGTGATAAGLVCGLSGNQKLIAYSVLKDESLKSRIDAFINTEKGPNVGQYIIQNADFGGYAKFDKPLLDFILSWLEQTDILLDPIYTSKMCRRVIQQIEAGEFEKGRSITLIHSGGLQGWRGMQQRVESLGGSEAWDQIGMYLEKT